MKLNDASTPLQKQPLWDIWHCRVGSHDRFFFKQNFSQSRRVSAVEGQVALDHCEAYTARGVGPSFRVSARTLASVAEVFLYS